jgi:hypothetical protein
MSAVMDVAAPRRSNAEKLEIGFPPVREPAAPAVVIHPHPDDYESEADYLDAVPGLMESIVEAMNSPESEWVDVPEKWVE